MSTLIEVAYVGRRAAWRDTVYQTGLTFDAGQVRALPPAVAQKLLRHADLFKEVQADEQAPALADDTAYLLEQGQEAAQQTEDRQIDFAIIDQINQMDKASLERFALERFAINLDKRKSVENLRAEVVSYIDRVGAP
jgi:hypothetical protein